MKIIFERIASEIVNYFQVTDSCGRDVIASAADDIMT